MGGLANARTTKRGAGFSALSCLAVFGAAMTCLLILAAAGCPEAALADVPAPWIWIEGEDWAQGNFPSGSAIWQTRGRFCASCSGQMSLPFVSGGRGRPYDPPGYWFTTYYFRAPQDGEYGAVWIAVANANVTFSWSVDGQPWRAARALEIQSSYGSDGFRWVRLDASAMGLALRQEDNPHTLELRRVGPSPANMQVDAIVFHADRGWQPNGTEKPPVDRSHLDSNPDYILFSSSYLEHVLPETEPNAGELVRTLWAMATLGEYEPLTFAIHARRELTDVEVVVSDLTTPEYVIPADRAEIHPVEVITKRLHVGSTPTQVEQVPEILARNGPLTIPEGQTKQYWLTVHVPPDAGPGEYEGTATILASNAPSSTLGIRLRVLPFALEQRPERSQRMSYLRLLEFAGEVLPDDAGVYLRQDLLDIQAHGIDSMNCNQHVAVSLDLEGDVVLDYSMLDDYMEALVELGFTKPVHWSSLGELVTDLRELGVSEERISEVYVQVASRIYDERAIRGWPEIYFMPVDEPFNRPEKEADFYNLVPLLRSALPDAVIECSMGDAAEMPAAADWLIDVRYYSGWSVDTWLGAITFQDIADAAAASGDELACYYNVRKIGGRPEFSRLSFGLYAWSSPFMQQGVWTYRHFSGDPYDDTDGEFPDLFYAYPDPDRNYAPLFPTLRWEGVREGIDDVRYLDTLEMAMERAAGEPTKADALSEARGFLDALRDRISRFGPELRGLEAYFSGPGYDAIRWEAAQAIMTLQVPSSTPTSLPTATGTATPSPTPTRQIHRAHIPLLLMPWS